MEVQLRRDVVEFADDIVVGFQEKAHAERETVCLLLFPNLSVCGGSRPSFKRQLPS